MNLCRRDNDGKRYSWDNISIVSADRLRAQADTQQVGGEHTVQTRSTHRISSITGKKWSGVWHNTE